MINKLSQYILYALMILAVIVTVISFSGNYDPIIYAMYAFFILSIFLAIVLFVAGMIFNPKGLKTTLFGLIGFAALFGISYALSGNEVLAKYGTGIAASDSKLIGMGIIAMYILFFGSIGAVIFSAVSRMFK